MDVTLAVQSFLNGVLLGGLIALVAVGFYLVLGIARVFNFAHGHVLVLGGFATWSFRENWGLNFWIAAFLGLVIMGVAGIIMERFPFRRFYGNFIPIIVVGVALLYLAEGGVVQAWGPELKHVGPVISGATDFWGVVMTNWRWLVIAVGIGSMAGVSLFLARTRVGRAMRATAVDPDTAYLQGISSIAMARTAMFAGCALAAVGGGLMAPMYGVNIAVGMAWMIKGMMAIILGGLGSWNGCLAACFMLGMAESYCTVYINPQAGYIAMFIMLVVVILFRPWGLFGKPLRLGMPGE